LSYSMPSDVSAQPFMPGPRPDRSNPIESDASRPVVSIIIANHNGAAYLPETLRSAQRQTLSNLEIIVSDDASSDESIALVRAMMADDLRIRLVQSDTNRGPSAARNNALAVARGEWIAVLDSDDLMHPERLERLIRAAQRDGADLVADNIIEFYQDGSVPPQALLRGHLNTAPRWIDIVDYIANNHFFARGPKLGFLKPIFRSSILSSTCYDETLTIAEDYDLVTRLLHSGKKFRLYPDQLYFYRKHKGSLSDRSSKKTFETLKAANQRFVSCILPHERNLLIAAHNRMRSIEVALVYRELVDSLKAAKWSSAFRISLTNPRVVLLLRFWIADRLGNFLSRLARPRSIPAAPETYNFLLDDRCGFLS
jgi:glycosyltransferase involved in cell wall biosynthesis